MGRSEPKFSVAFGLLSVMLACSAALRARMAPVTAAELALIWSAVSFGVVALAYAGVGPRVFGKSARGRLSPAAMLLTAPYLAGAWLVLLLLRLRREAAHHEIRPGLFLGRKPLGRDELPPGVRLVVDLTAEFPGLAPVSGEYVAVPTLDGSVPDDAAFASAVDRVRAHDGVSYVHCAAGHGRSAAVVACVLVAEGRAASPEDAERLMTDVRPGVRMSRLQKALVRRVTGRS